MKHLELFKHGFDSTITEKIKPENWPYVGYDAVSGKVAFSQGSTKKLSTIYYTTIDGEPYQFTKLVTDAIAAGNYGGPNVISNQYDSSNDTYVLYFEGDLTDIGMDVSSQKVYPCFGKYIDDPESNITGIFLPDTLINIKALAFGACQHLEGVSIPASVVYIGQSAFGGCTQLSHIIYAGTIQQWDAIEKGLQWNYNCPEITVHCTDRGVIIPVIE